VLVGALVHIECNVEKLGNKSIRYKQVMYLSDTGEQAAQNLATSVLFDMQNRCAITLPDNFREKFA
jgi:acyl-CoA thioester hydrolase